MYKNVYGYISPLFLYELKFLYFFIVASNLKNSMYPQSFLCEEAKIKQRTSLKKELYEISEEANGNPDSHAFLFFRYRKQNYFSN